MSKPLHLTAKEIMKARDADQSGNGKRLTVSGHVLKVLTELAYREMRVGDYNKEVNDIVVSMKHYMDKGVFDNG